jgi:hypothetical protein
VLRFQSGSPVLHLRWDTRDTEALERVSSDGGHFFRYRPSCSPISRPVAAFCLSMNSTRHFIPWTLHNLMMATKSIADLPKKTPAAFRPRQPLIRAYRKLEDRPGESDDGACRALRLTGVRAGTGLTIQISFGRDGRKPAERFAGAARPGQSSRPSCSSGVAEERNRKARNSDSWELVQGSRSHWGKVLSEHSLAILPSASPDLLNQNE